MAGAGARIDGIPITRHWLIPKEHRPKVYIPHPTLSADEIRARTQAVWDRFYSLPQIWALAGGHVISRQTRVRAHLQTVSADVREHGHRGRQRPDGAIGSLGEMDRASVPAALCHGADAALTGADFLNLLRAGGTPRRRAAVFQLRCVRRGSPRKVSRYSRVAVSSDVYQRLPPFPLASLAPLATAY
jgi:hypothetical protein